MTKGSNILYRLHHKKLKAQNYPLRKNLAQKFLEAFGPGFTIHPVTQGEGGAFWPTIGKAGTGGPPAPPGGGDGLPLKPAGVGANPAVGD